MLCGESIEIHRGDIGQEAVQPLPMKTWSPAFQTPDQQFRPDNLGNCELSGIDGLPANARLLLSG